MDVPAAQDFAQLASETRVAKVREALEANGFAVHVVDTGAEAKDLVLGLLPENAEVLAALSRTLEVTGIADVIDQSGRYDAVRPKVMKLDRKTQAREMRKLRGAPDILVGSAHAVTEAGEIVMGSGSGSQIGPTAYSAGKVILVIGTQKLVADLDEGMRRLEEYTVPLENKRMMEAHGMPTMLTKVLIYKREPAPGRSTIVLVRENLGF
jgi:hypothetical protein